MDTNLANTLTQNFTVIAYMMQSISVLMGVTFTLGGIFKLKKLGESRGMMSQEGSVAGPLVMIIAGAMLLILPAFISAMGLALFGYRNPLAYSNGVDNSGLVGAILMLVRLVGVGSFMRGITLLARAGGHGAQQGTVGKAIIHMIAGVMCVHIYGTLDLIGQLMGLTD